MKNMKKKNMNKKLLLLLLVMAVAMASIGATIAWMTAESELENTFVVGKFNDPVVEPGEEDPDDPDPQPGVTPDGTTDRLDGNLYEPSWNDNSKMTPGATIPKDPYVGIGKDSEDAYVYIYVDNNFKNTNETIGFYINNGWEAVEDYVEYNPSYSDSETETERTDKKFYTGGLFKYTAGLTGASTDEKWTETSLFSNIIIQDEATVDDLTAKDAAESSVGNATITVKSFIHQMNDGATSSTNDMAAIAKAAAIDTLNAVKIENPENTPAAVTP